MRSVFQKRMVVIPVVLLMIAITACSSSIPAIFDKDAGNMAENSNVQTRDGQITLKLWHLWVTDADSNKKPFLKVINEWNAANPHIQIEAEATENEIYKNRIKTAIAVNEAPDIFYSWGAGFAKPFVDAGKVLPLDRYLNDGTKDKLIPGSLDNFTYDGKVYGLPIFIIAGVFYCNKELFDKYGIKIPDSFNELTDAVKAFKEKGIVPMAVGEKDGWTGMFYQNILAIRTAGINMCNQALSKQASFDRPEFAESAQRLVELIKAGAFDSRCMSMTRDEAEENFKNGKCAMYYNGSWVAGSLDEDGCPVKDKIIVKNFPVLENAKGDSNGFLGGAIDTFMINADTKYKDEAVKALKTIDENFSRESYLAGASQPAWNVSMDETRISPLAAEVSKLLKSSTGFVLAWDTFLPGLEAQAHINLVTDIFAGRRIPEDFTREMQKLNETAAATAEN
ncbi:MAG: extracellular solute-binding protein [Clostridiaceae bacterium]